jgi:hemerythrin-like domain-containing protein
MAALHASLQIIRRDHQLIASVLSSMQQTIHRGPGDTPEWFFDMMRNMLFYLDEFPERLHHAYETKVLFPRLIMRVSTLDKLIDQLNADHQASENAVKQLQHSLLAWEIMGEHRRQCFELEALRFVDQYFEHMKLEEKEIFPSAMHSLREEDWKLINDAFIAHCTMSDTAPHDPRYARLLTRIMIHAPSASS